MAEPKKLTDAEAFTTVMRALNKLRPEQQKRVLKAAAILLEADAPAPIALTEVR